MAPDEDNPQTAAPARPEAQATPKAGPGKRPPLLRNTDPSKLPADQRERWSLPPATWEEYTWDERYRWREWFDWAVSEDGELWDAKRKGAKLFNAHLEGADLWRADLRAADLYFARLEGAALVGAHLERADLTWAHLEGADLRWAHLKGADLRAADLSNADVTGVRYDRHRLKCQGIRAVTCHGHPVFRRDAEDQDFIETFRSKSWWHSLLYVFWAVLTDCGRSLLRVALVGTCLAVLFGWVFASYPHMLDLSDSAQTPWTPYYYSIVTFTTLGFGDVTPATFEGELWVGAEVLVGYLVLGLLISILANKVARRS